MTECDLRKRGNNEIINLLMHKVCEFSMKVIFLTLIEYEGKHVKIKTVLVIQHKGKEV